MYFFFRAEMPTQFLRHVMRAVLSIRPKCSHRCVSLNKSPLNPCCTGGNLITGFRNFVGRNARKMGANYKFPSPGPIPDNCPQASPRMGKNAQKYKFVNFRPFFPNFRGRIEEEKFVISVPIFQPLRPQAQRLLGPSKGKTTCNASQKFETAETCFNLFGDLSGPVLRDTARLSQRYPPIARYGVFGVSTWQIGCDTPSPFSERFPPWRACEVEVRYPPLQRGISAILARYPMRTRQMGAMPPSAILSRKGIARYGGVSRTGPLSWGP